MAITSYNETKNRQIGLQHVFFPGGYAMAAETIIGVLALIIFNISALSDQLLESNVNTNNIFSLWSQTIRQALDKLGQHNGVQQAVLFVLWAVVGALIYILVFRLIQIVFGVKRSVKLGFRYVRQDHDKGLFRWLASLHDFFVKALIVCLGTAAVTIGSLVCFGIASQELNQGLAKPFPANIGPLILSLVGAVISIRLILLGISLLSRHFRDWYTN